MHSERQSQGNDQTLVGAKAFKGDSFCPNGMQNMTAVALYKELVDGVPG